MSKSKSIMEGAAKASEAKFKKPKEGSPAEEKGESASEEKLEDQLCPTCHQKVLEHFGKKAMRYQ